MQKHLGFVFLGCFVLAFAGCPHGGPHGLSFSFEVTGLDVVEPKGDSLNDHDWAAGGWAVGDGNFAPVVWLDGELIFVADNAPSGVLHGINNRGAVVGVRIPQNNPPNFLEQFIDSRITEFQSGRGQYYSINEYDEIVGEIDPPGSSLDRHALLTSIFGNDVFIFPGDDGGNSVSYGINDAGDFVGSSTDIGGDMTINALKWVKGVLTPLSSLGGPFSEAYAISDHGVTVGVSTAAADAKTNVPHIAVCWPETDLVELPTLGGENSTAWDINNDGDTVGFSEDENGDSRAILWTASGRSGNIRAIDLNDVVDFGDATPGSIILRDAVDINEPGSIVCRADRSVGDAVEQIYVLLRR